MARYREQNPQPPLLFEGFVFLFSAIALILGAIHASQLHRAPTYTSYPLVTWAQAGYGTLYFVPPGLTLIFSVLNWVAYRKYATPLLYAVLFSSFMVASWVVTIAWWIQCHVDLLEIDDRFCYQRSLRSGRGKQLYRNVNDSVAEAMMAFGVLTFLVYVLYVVLAAIYVHRDRRARKCRGVNGYAIRYGTRDGEKSQGGYAGGCYAVGMPVLSGFGGGDGGGCGGYSGGGDGGGGGGGGGDGGGGGGGGGC